MTIRVFAVSNKAEVRNRLSRGSLLLQTSQLQPSTGTPLEVPVPRKVKPPLKPPPTPPKGGEPLMDSSLLISSSCFNGYCCLYVLLSSKNTFRFLFMLPPLALPSFRRGWGRLSPFGGVGGGFNLEMYSPLDVSQFQTSPSHHAELSGRV